MHYSISDARLWGLTTHREVFKEETFQSYTDAAQKAAGTWNADLELEIRIQKYHVDVKAMMMMMTTTRHQK